MREVIMILIGTALTLLFALVLGKISILFTSDELKFNFDFFLSEEQKENKKAELAREKILNTYYREYLAYGFSKHEATILADKKLKAEALEASGIGKEGSQPSQKSANRV